MKKNIVKAMLCFMILSLLTSTLQPITIFAATSQLVQSGLGEAAMEGYSYADRETMMREYYDAEIGRGTVTDYTWLIQDGKHYYHVGRNVDGVKGAEDLTILYSTPIGISQKSTIKIPYSIGWKSAVRSAQGSLAQVNFAVYAGNEISSQVQIGGENVYLSDKSSLVGEYQLELKDNYKYITIFVLTGNFFAGGLGKGYSYELRTYGDTEQATPTQSAVTINGGHVGFEAYNIGGNNYFKLRDIAMAITGTAKNFDVGYDSAKKAITLTSNSRYTPVGGELVLSGNTQIVTGNLTVAKIYLNGTEVSLIGYNIGGSNYFKLRDLGKLFDFSVNYNTTTKVIDVDTAKNYGQ